MWIWMACSCNKYFFYVLLLFSQKQKLCGTKQKIYIWHMYGFKIQVFSKTIFDGYSYPSHNPRQSFLLHVTFLKFFVEENFSFSEHANLPKKCYDKLKDVYFINSKGFFKWGVSLWYTRVNFHNMRWIVSQIMREIRISFSVQKSTLDRVCW